MSKVMFNDAMNKIDKIDGILKELRRDLTNGNIDKKLDLLTINCMLSDIINIKHMYDKETDVDKTMMCARYLLKEYEGNVSESDIAREYRVSTHDELED